MKKYISRISTLKLIAVWIMVMIFMFFSKQITGLYSQPIIAIALFLIVLGTIITAAFAVVKEADVLAHKLGEPYGTLILTLSIVSIEVILIAAMMFGPTEAPTIGKDSIFSVMMIIMNLVTGLCLILGGLKYGEQEYNAPGSLTYHGMIIMLAGIAMMLPNYIVGQGNGEFSQVQAISISLAVVVVYTVFLVFQMKGYRHLYMQPAVGNMEITFKEAKVAQAIEANAEDKISRTELLSRTVILLLWILPIVLLSHNLASLVDFGITSMNLPTQLGGVLIAIIVFTPESITAVKAALNNEFQRAINLCHGAFVSTVGLTVPCVLTIGLLANKTVQFGMTGQETILFIITLVLSLFTFQGKRTSPIFGVMQLMLFVIFVLLIFQP